MRNFSLKNKGGFTLIEVMVAVAIIGIISVSLVQLLQTSLRLWNRGTSKMSIYNNLSMCLEYISRNIVNAIPAVSGDYQIPVFLFNSEKNVIYSGNGKKETIHQAGGPHRIDFVARTGSPTHDYNLSYLIYYISDITGLSQLQKEEAYPLPVEEFENLFLLQREIFTGIIPLHDTKPEIRAWESGVRIRGEAVGYNVTGIQYSFCGNDLMWVDEWSYDEKSLPKAIKITVYAADENYIYGNPTEINQGDSLSLTVRLYQNNAPSNWW